MFAQVRSRNSPVFKQVKEIDSMVTQGTECQFQVVFIPGLLLTETLYKAQIADLPEGQSYHVADTTNTDSFTVMAERIISQTELDILPVGLSMGGYVALELARLYPERVRGIALLSTNSMSETPERRKMRQELISLSQIGKFKGVTPRLLPRLLSKPAQQDEALKSTVMDMAAEIGQENFVLQQTAIMHRLDQRPNLPNIKVPSLVLCGDADLLTPPSQSEETAALLPDAELQILDGIGHLSSMEAPEAVNAALRRLYGRIGAR